MSLASLVRGASVDGRVRLGWDETQAGGKSIEYKEEVQLILLKGHERTRRI